MALGKFRQMTKRLVKLLTKTKTILFAAMALFIAAIISSIFLDLRWSAALVASIAFLAVWTSLVRSDSQHIARAKKSATEHRRILAAIEGARLEGFDRHTALSSQLDSLRKHVATPMSDKRLLRVEGHYTSLSSQLAELRRSVMESGTNTNAKMARDRETITTALWRQTQDFEALLQLYGDRSPSAANPSSGGWALNPTTLLELLSIAERSKPATVVELGSGASTVWLARLVQQWSGTFVSIEHDADYMNKVSNYLDHLGLAEHVDLRSAPLRAVTRGDFESVWYDYAAFSDIENIDLLLIDGPPRGTTELARYAALPLLVEKLSSKATIVLDDAHRAEEQEIIRRWVEETPGLTERPTMFWPHRVLEYRRSMGSR